MTDVWRATLDLPGHLKLDVLRAGQMRSLEVPSLAAAGVAVG